MSAESVKGAGLEWEGQAGTGGEVTPSLVLSWGPTNVTSGASGWLGAAVLAGPGRVWPLPCWGWGLLRDPCNQTPGPRETDHSPTRQADPFPSRVLRTGMSPKQTQEAFAHSELFPPQILKVPCGSGSLLIRN